MAYVISMQSRDADLVFRALGDPTRRHILELLSNDERSVKQLTSAFGITQPAISQHLRVLREAGLASERRVGRNRFYRMDSAPLRQVEAWLQEHTDFWTSKIEGLGEYLRRRNGENDPV